MYLTNLLQPFATLLSYLYFKKDRLRLKKLMNKGMKIGKNVYIVDDVEFDEGYPFLIEIGDNCRIGKGVRILTHDATTFRDLGVTRIAPVRILEGSFIGERAVILPGVTIGPRAMIGAGSMVNRDIGEGKVAAGNPARPYGTLLDLLEKNRESARSVAIFNIDDIERGLVTPEQIASVFGNVRWAFVYGIPAEDPYYVNAEKDVLLMNARQRYEETISFVRHNEEHIDEHNA